MHTACFEIARGRRIAQWAALALLPVSVHVVAAPASDSPRGDAYGDAFLNYQPYVTPAAPVQASAPASNPPTQTASAPATVAETGPQKVDVAFLRKVYPVLEERAINDPTDANISAYMYTKRIILDKAQRFSQSVARALRQDPLLDENNRVPYASTGALSVRNADYQAQQKAVEELARIGGLVAFVDSTCRFCAMQLPVLDMLKRAHKIEYLVVSLDGARPKGFNGPLISDNGLFRKLGLKLTPSIVFVPRPRAYVGADDPNRYLVVSQGFYAMDELVKQIAYAGHDTKLLSAEVMRDLNVWDRGVTTTQDLNKLRLDPNKPDSFREILQPYLLKQYQN
ncbi:conjugal transfer protein TraF [Burkholderia cenocepacia]|uniref:conjugal transfer protein TraF n=1 Tax=Burkholderia cenocepacia TaxID=95486 RepID=UPI00234BEC0A|nr:conjugal transfer protein TraF [Burkholderia cenocepacia]MDC6085783.1 conjugal transfer protein TraF [Burkholderia cenocepacia]